MRKKVFLTLSVIFMLGMGVTAQPKPSNPASNDIKTYGIRRMSSDEPPQAGGPLTPATLLLIAMAGGYAGVKLYHNSKNNTGK